jgi:hypothetical protein
VSCGKIQAPTEQTSDNLSFFPIKFPVLQHKGPCGYDLTTPTGHDRLPSARGATVQGIGGNISLPCAALAIECSCASQPCRRSADCVRLRQLLTDAL